MLSSDSVPKSVVKMSLEGILTIIGADLTVVLWILIGLFTWLWWTPFHEAQKTAGDETQQNVTPSLLDLLIATIILLSAQAVWCYLTLVHLIAWYVATDSTRHPDRALLLIQVLCLWSVLTVVSTIGAYKLARIIVSGYRRLPHLLHTSLRHWGEATNQSDVDVERVALLHASAPGTNAFKHGSFPTYRSAILPTIIENHDSSSSDFFFASDSATSTHRQPIQRKHHRSSRIRFSNAHHTRTTLNSHKRALTCQSWRPSAGLVSDHEPSIPHLTPLPSPALPLSDSPNNGIQHVSSAVGEEIEFLRDEARGSNRRNESFWEPFATTSILDTPINGAQSVLSDADDEMDEPGDRAME